MTWTSKATGTAAGGYNNAVYFDEVLEDHIICAGDTFALNESFDGGDNWWPANYGLYTGAQGFGAVYGVPNDGILLAAHGSNGSPPLTVVMGEVQNIGGQLVTVWEHRPKQIGIFYGGGNAPWLPAGDQRPRACGRLFARNPAQTFVYAIPYTNGLWRSGDYFNTATRIVAPSSMNQKLQTVVCEPGGNRILVGTWAYDEPNKEGAYLIDQAQSAGTDAAQVLPLSGAPRTVLEFCVVGNNVYAACGWYGVYKVTGSNWNTWTKINTGSSWPSTNPGTGGQPYAVGIDGKNVGGDDVLIVSICNPIKLAGDANFTSIMRCIGADNPTPGAWESLTGDSQYQNNVWGSGEPWWPVLSFASFAPNKGSGEMENVAFDPFDATGNKVHIVGRAGGHQIRNAQAAAGSVVVRPAVNGQSGTTTRMLIADPGRLNHIYTANTDHKVVASGSDYAPGTVRKIAPGAAGGDAGTWLDIGPDGKLYAAIAKRDYYRDNVPEAGTSYGEIWRYEGNPMTSAQVSEGLNTATPAHDKPAGLLVTGTAGSPIKVVGVIGRGIWRKVGTGAWSKVVSETVFSVNPVRNQLFPTAKDIDGDTVFMVEPDLGVFRSLDQGATWPGPGGTPAAGVWWTGGTFISIAAAPLVSGKLFGCRTNGIWRVDSSDVLGTNPNTAAVRITPATGPMTSLQGMTVDRQTGNVMAITRPTATVVGKAYLCTNPHDATPTWTEVSDAKFSAACYSLNWVCTDGPNGQVFQMPGGVMILEDDGVVDPGTPPGVGTKMGGTRFHLVRSEVA